MNQKMAGLYRSTVLQTFVAWERFFVYFSAGKMTPLITARTFKPFVTNERVVRFTVQVSTIGTCITFIDVAFLLSSHSFSLSAHSFLCSLAFFPFLSSRLVYVSIVRMKFSPCLQLLFIRWGCYNCSRFTSFFLVRLVAHFGAGLNFCCQCCQCCQQLFTSVHSSVCYPLIFSNHDQLQNIKLWYRVKHWTTSYNSFHNKTSTTCERPNIGLYIYNGQRNLYSADKPVHRNWKYEKRSIT